MAERFYMSDQKTGNRMIEDVTLSHKATEVIREMIIEGVCPMGSRVLEADFAGSLGVSRSVIREAFIALENDGLLVRNTNRSTIVKDFTREDVENIYNVRIAIECMCLETSMDGVLLNQAELLAQAREIDDTYEHSRRPLEWMKLDMRFHEYLVYASNNVYAWKVWKSLESQILTILSNAFKKVPDILVPRNETIGHPSLVNDILAGDKARAVDKLKRHIREGAVVIRDTYQ